MRGARGRETATKPGARGASGTPGASAHTPAPPALMSEDAGAELFHFSLFFFFLFFFIPSLPTSQIGGDDGFGLFFLLFFFLILFGLFFFFFLNIWKFLHPLRSDKEKKKALTRQNPRNPSSILAAVLGGVPRAPEGPRAAVCLSRGRWDALPAPSHGGCGMFCGAGSGQGMLPRTRPWGCASELQNLERVKEKILKNPQKDG